MKLVEKARAAKASITEKNQTRKRLRGPINLQCAIADSITLLDTNTSIKICFVLLAGTSVAWHALTQRPN